MGVRSRTGWSSAVLALAAWVGSSSCGGADKPLFDPGTFSGQHEAEIRKDCMESLQCAAQRGMELPPDPMDKCVTESAQRLEDMEDKQESFLRNIGRCGNFVVCAYYDCATSNASGFSDTQRDKVTHDCQASLDCQAEQGHPVDDPASALRGCVSIRAGSLDGYTAAQQQMYVATFANCQTLGGCQFTGCFGNGLPGM